MNIRVLGFVLLIILFAVASAMFSLSVSGGVSLTDAYNSGNVKVIQKSAAGAIPHEVEIFNNGNSVINIKKGNVLSSSLSEELVIAENKQIAPSTSNMIKAFGIESSQRAVPDSKFLPVNNTYSAVDKIITVTNLQNSQITYEDQLKIWIIMSEGNFNPYTGEPVAVVENKGITWTQFRQNVQEAKSDIMKTFNVNDNEIKNLNHQTMKSPNWVDAITNWIKNALRL